MDEWAQQRIKPPLVVGHEFSGRVEKVGSEVSRVEVGDIVASETHVVCGSVSFVEKAKAIFVLIQKLSV